MAREPDTLSDHDKHVLTLVWARNGYGLFARAFHEARTPLGHHPPYAKVEVGLPTKLRAPVMRADYSPPVNEPDHRVASVEFKSEYITDRNEMFEITTVFVGDFIIHRDVHPVSRSR